MRIASAGFYIQALAYDEEFEGPRVMRLFIDGGAKCRECETKQIIQLLYDGIEQGKSSDEISSMLDEQDFSCLKDGYELEEN